MNVSRLVAYGMKHVKFQLVNVSLNYTTRKAPRTKPLGLVGLFFSCSLLANPPKLAPSVDSKPEEDILHQEKPNKPQHHNARKYQNDSHSITPPWPCSYHAQR